jgi:DNA polymerase-1
MSGFRLARELGIAVGTATQYIEKYFSNFPGVQEFFDRLDRESKQHGFVKTLFGRKRYIAAIDSSGRDDGFVRRAALNAPLQGSAADIIKLAMLGLEQRIAAQKLALSMLLQIHDELLFECAKDFAKEAQALIQQIMEQVVTLSVPLRVDVGIGCNWQEAH